MQERDALFWAGFSHGWSGAVLGITILALVIAIILGCAQKRAPGNRVLAKIALASKVVSASTVVFALLTQMHLPCATLAALSTRCSLNLRKLVQAQALYAADHDDHVFGSPDWQARLGQQQLRCPAAKDNVSYAINRAVIKVRLSDMSGETVLLFESGDQTIGGTPDLAAGRHQGRPWLVTIDGHAQSYRPGKTKW